MRSSMLHGSETWPLDPSVDGPKIILFQHGTTSKIILSNFSVLF